MNAVDTRKVATRRQVRFATLDDVAQDVDNIVTAYHQDNLTTLGNWTPGQTLAHLAAWIEYGYVGYPLRSPPWFVRIILRRMLRRYLDRGMPSGVRIPGQPSGTVGQDEMPVDDAAARLKTALRRLKNNEACTYDSPAFGPMTHTDRIRLNLRHAELHLSFLSY